MLAVDQGWRVLARGQRGPQHSILGDKWKTLSSLPLDPYSSTQNTARVSHGHLHSPQPGNSHSWFPLSPAFPLAVPCFLVSGSNAPSFSLSFFPVYTHLPCPSGSVLWTDATLSTEHLRSCHWVTCGEGGQLYALHTLSSQHLAQCLVQGGIRRM